MRLVLLVVALALVTAGCGAQEEAGPPPTLPAAALPELTSSVRTLDAVDLAADALRPAALERLLEQADFELGREREFSGKTTTFDHVVARTLRFADPEGAETYLGWLRGHGRDLIGRADRARIATPGESGVAFTLARCGTCKKELPTFLAGWRRGELVLSLLAAGSGANPERFSSLARELDAIVG